VGEYAVRVAVQPTTSFESFVARNSSSLAGFALMVTGNRQDAQDVVQDALIAAYPRWQRLSEGGDPLAYVRRSIVNRQISLRRKLYRLVALGDREPVSADPTVQLADADWALSLVGRLPDRQRIAVILRVMEDRSFAEVAELLGVSEANARKLVSRGVAALRTHLSEGEH